ncbi:hypothetical protein ABEB36_005225 [Hypothenemus hampei]|uniref:CREG-like beta-barrel domain-containing protein n=1 Tax=Hypothenemus hampei TaxID=57062 RepID=A0ABD1EXK4_HYPHA
MIQMSLTSILKNVLFVTLLLNIPWEAQCANIQHGSGGRYAASNDSDSDAVVARRIIRDTNWLSIATISTHEGIEGYPFVSLKSFSDGPNDNGTGIPYLYMTDQDISALDLLQNNNVSIMASLAELSDGCADYDPQDPRCSKVMITGKYIKIESSSDEFSFGKEALFAKHPQMEYWPDDHGFYVAKIEIQEILLLNNYGGLKTVSVEDYFSPSVTRIVNAEH